MPLTTFDKAVWPEGRGPTWKTVDDGFAGPFGSVRRLVVTDETGNARHDRPINFEAPHVIMVVWGVEEYVGPKIGLIKEARPTAGQVGLSVDPIFWGVPRGFVKKGEQSEEAARRELCEEAGATHLMSLRQIGEINPNPTCFNSWGPVYEARVRLSSLVASAPTRNEKIFKAEFFRPEEIFNMIVRKEHDGALLSDGVSLAALMMLFAQNQSFR